jgi:hypothetical protein
VPGPAWNDDSPADAPRIAANAATLIRSLRADAALRVSPSVSLVCGWHRALYDGCAVPSSHYLGAFRGAADQVDDVVGRLAETLSRLDGYLPVGDRPTTPEEVDAVVGLIAQVHGEWVRIHPFASGNGRTARTWAAWLALRYGLPVFVTLKPRPDDVGYAQAARASMGEPPDFVGDHEPAHRVFLDLLARALGTS